MVDNRSSAVASYLTVKPAFQLKFNGENTNTFLRQYEVLQEAMGATDDGRVQALPLYLNSEFLEEVMDWEEFKAKDWKKIKDKMLATFNDEDVNRYTMKDLKALAEKQHTQGLTSIYGLKSYNRRFTKISRWLKKKEELGWQEESRLYLKGVPSAIRDVWERDRRLDRREERKKGGTVPKLEKVEAIFTALLAILEDSEAFGTVSDTEDDQLKHSATSSISNASSTATSSSSHSSSSDGSDSESDSKKDWIKARKGLKHRKQTVWTEGQKGAGKSTGKDKKDGSNGRSAAWLEDLKLQVSAGMMEIAERQEQQLQAFSNELQQRQDQKLEAFPNDIKSLAATFAPTY